MLNIYTIYTVGEEIKKNKIKIHATALQRSALKQDIILVPRFMLGRLKHEHTNNKIVIVEKRGLRIKL